MEFNITVKEIELTDPTQWINETEYPKDGFYKVKDSAGINMLVLVGPFNGMTRWVNIIMKWEEWINMVAMVDVYPGEGYVPPIRYKIENSVSEEFCLEMLDKVINGINDGKGVSRK